MEMLSARAQALRVMEADARKNAELIDQKCERALIMIKDYELIFDIATNNMQCKMLVVRFMVQGSQLFFSTERVEKSSVVGTGDVSRIVGFNTTDILRRFAVFMRMLD